MTWNRTNDIETAFADALLSDDTENNNFEFADTNNCRDIDSKCSPAPSSVGWALSPYSELEHFDYALTSPNPPTPILQQQDSPALMQQKNMSHLRIPEMERQSSLNMVLEVLGPNMEDNEDELNNEPPLPTPFAEEDAHIATPSPSFPSFELPSCSTSRHRNVSWGGSFAPAVNTSNRVRAVSEDATAYSNYPVDIASLLDEHTPIINCCTGGIPICHTNL